MSAQKDFDLFLAAACNEYCKTAAKEFLSTDTAGFEITPNERRRFRRIARASEKAQKPRISIVRIVAAACIIVLCAIITACVAVPKIREAIKRAVIEWHDKYITIEFVEETSESESQSETEIQTTEATTSESAATETEEQTTGTIDTADTTEVTKSIQVQKPTKIEKKAYASHLPNGYTYEINADTKGSFVTSYYYCNDIKFSLIQKIITEQMVWANSEEQSMSHVNVNHYNAVLLESTEEANLYVLVWQDNQYEYTIEGYFSSKDEIISIAEGIQLQ